MAGSKSSAASRAARTPAAAGMLGRRCMAELGRACACACVRVRHLKSVLQRQAARMACGTGAGWHKESGVAVPERTRPGCLRALLPPRGFTAAPQRAYLPAERGRTPSAMPRAACALAERPTPYTGERTRKMAVYRGWRDRVAPSYSCIKSTFAGKQCGHLHVGTCIWALQKTSLCRQLYGMRGRGGL